ncbi:unnamed protein product [Cuscuta epithymum]|uniref:LAGLIDADG homing endonuclease n=1 Tax=Cuscuta epithymum TaxID=186058 RepID=A0AAV0CD80_9ASTE|nr:unnamed protein product [Cuscuta epithymum]
MAGDAANNDGDGHYERQKINDPSSPYHLSNSDHPGMTICSGRGTAHAMHVGEYREAKPVLHENKETNMHKPGFTDEQWQSFLKLMEKCKTTPTKEKLTGPTYEDANWSG